MSKRGFRPLAGILRTLILGAIAIPGWAADSENAPPFPTAHAAFTSTPPVIDGKLDDAAWEKAGQVELSLTLGRATFLPEKTVVKLLYDTSRLYIAFQAWDSEIRQKARSHDDIQVHADDCVELFLTPPVHQIAEAVGFEINAGGDILDYRLRPEEFININWGPKHLQCATRPTSSGTTPESFTGYTVELSIPWAELARITPGGKAPTRLRANFARYNYNGSGRVLTIWSDPRSRFHTPSNPDGYGWLILDPP